MTEANVGGSHPIPVVDPEPARRRVVEGVVRALPGAPPPEAAATARELPRGTYDVGAVSLAAHDPVAEARYLVLHRHVRVLVFYGTAEERAHWWPRISYEPLLPSERFAVDVSEARELSRALEHAVQSVRERGAAQPVLRRLSRESDSLRRAVEATVLDALDVQGVVRDAYAAVLRGSLTGLEDARGERLPEEARRTLRSALRRVEALRGPEERDRVARSLAALFERASGEAPEVVVVSSSEDVALLHDALREAAAGAGLDAASGVALRVASENAVRDLGGPPGRAEVRRERGRVRVRWENARGHVVEFAFASPRA